MDSAFYCFILAFLEMTFIYAGLLILHGLRRVIGIAGFYIALGLLFVFMQISGAAGFRVETGLAGLNFDLMSIGLLLPFLAALMVIYISDGTLAAQRVIIGMIAMLGFYLYLAKLSDVGSFAIPASKNFDFRGLLSQSLRPMAANVTSFALDIFLIPIIYQGLRNLRCRLFISVMGALVFVQLTDSVVYAIIRYMGQPDWWRGLTDSYLARMVATLWLSAISSVYLARIDSENPGEGRSPFEIIIAFFGNYGKAKELEANLKRTEERFKLLFENAGDMVLVINKDGKIMNANHAAVQLMGLDPVSNENIPDFTELSGIAPDTWLYRPAEGDPIEILPVKAVMKRTERSVELTFTAFHPDPDQDDLTEYIVFGRDVTEREKLEHEIEEWHLRTMHNQRLESIGRLAGGIAHDFNNLLHAIQGHLDIIQYMHPVDDPDVVRHLDKVSQITDKASLLTKQMLGFARKGNYQPTTLDPAEIIRSAIELFTPNATAAGTVQIRMDSIPEQSGLHIEGDIVQIQQILLNIFINARDAMKDVPEKDRFITLTLFADQAEPDFVFTPPPETTPKKDVSYCIIRIADKGPGIPQSILNRIFEPFYTTKPVGQGTGMGLAMAYGTMIAHKGWIQCHNAAEGGAVFELVFPLSNPEKNKDA